MEKRLTMILASLFLCVGMAVAQTSVTGTVVSQEDGQPVVGATVRVEGSNSGTVTDVDGKFSVSAPADAYLTVTYIGMKEARVKAGRNMRIVLENDELGAQARDHRRLGGHGRRRQAFNLAGVKSRRCLAGSGCGLAGIHLFGRAFGYGQHAYPRRYVYLCYDSTVVYIGRQ